MSRENICEAINRSHRRDHFVSTGYGDEIRQSHIFCNFTYSRKMWSFTFPAVGRTAHPWRVAEARLTVSQSTVAKYLGRRDGPPVSDVAHLAHQPRRPARLGRLLHGPHCHASRIVCVHSDVAQPTAYRPPERYRAPDAGVDRATAPRGVAMGHRAAIRHPGPRWNLGTGLSECHAGHGN